MAGRYDDDDDESPFDRNGLLKDGRTTRVSMMARDGLSDVQRTIMADKAARQFDDSGCRHQLGLRYLPTRLGASARQSLRCDVRRTPDAWKTPSSPAVTEASNLWKTNNMSDREVARLHNTGDARRDAYLDYVADLTSAWQRRR